MKTSRRGFLGLLGKAAGIAAATAVSAKTGLALCTGEPAKKLEELARDDAFRSLRSQNTVLVPAPKKVLWEEPKIAHLTGEVITGQQAEYFWLNAEEERPVYIADLLRQIDHKGKLFEVPAPVDPSPGFRQWSQKMDARS